MITPGLTPAGPSDVARHYDELDRFYRALWGEHLHHGLFEHRREDPAVATERLVDRVADLGEIGAGTEVCDVGCGYGATARKLAVERGARVRALTLSAAQVKVARARTPGTLPPGASLEVLQGNWLRNDFSDGSFDTVIAIECLTHMPDQAAFFAEATRTLRPGGRLVVCAWLTGDAPGRAARRWLLEPICREGELPGMGSAAETRELISGAGLELLAFQDWSGAVRRTWTVCARRVASALATDPAARRLLRDPAVRSRGFARSVFRIWLAYRVGAMRYGLFVARRPVAGSGG
ncbi:MAG: methyltransferase domain-containing protein [Gemmatimonadales bacterium]|nr:MAG: methyltransferase domain-containing protein [Gemmatimonadales bacterium]